MKKNKKHFCGIDIVSIPRIRDASRHENFLKRVFTGLELDYSLKRRTPCKHFAGRFAAKEACLKALTTGFGSGINWKDIEVVNSKEGRPLLRLGKEAKRHLSGRKIFLSIAYSKDLALASVIIE